MGQVINISRLSSSIDFGIKTIQRHEIKKEMLAEYWDHMIDIGRNTIHGFTIDNDNYFAYKQAFLWAVGSPLMRALNPADDKLIIEGDTLKGLYIAGASGTGKSILLEVLRNFMTSANLTYSIDSTKNWMNFQMYRSGEIYDDYRETGQIQKYKFAKRLIIQDLGSEPCEGMHMGNRQSVIGQILEYRGDQYDQITLISSNNSMLGRGDIKLNNDQYGSRVLSRLPQMCNYLVMKGKDRRL